MKTERNRIIRINKDGKLWQQYQWLGRMAKDLNRLPDAAEVQRNRSKTAPLQLTQMLF